MPAEDNISNPKPTSKIIKMIMVFASLLKLKLKILDIEKVVFGEYCSEGITKQYSPNIKFLAISRDAREEEFWNPPKKW